MNIFATSPDPIACAQALDSRRLVKMMTETAQILCTANYVGPCKPTHEKHPVVLWAAECPTNSEWLFDHYIALTDEYNFRFGKKHSLLPSMWKVSSAFAADICAERTEFANCARNAGLELDFTHLPVHTAYRAYLNARWRLEFARAAEPQTEYFDGETIRLSRKYHAPTWGARGKPDWEEV